MCRGKLCGKQIFRGKLYLFIIFGLRKKNIRNFVTNFQKRNCVHFFTLVCWNVINDFFCRNYVSVHYFGTCPTKFQNPEKNFQTAFPKVYSTFPEERFQISVVFSKETVNFHQSWTLKRNCFRISCQIYVKVVITEIYLSNWTL